MNQKKAKVLIKDYLRESGRKGVTSLMRDLSKSNGGKIFSKRNMELWLKEQDRQLNDHNWEPVKNFIESDKFKGLVNYANVGRADERLKQVAEGFMALYGTIKHPDGLYVFPSEIQEKGMAMARELHGPWKKIPNGFYGEEPHCICKMEHIPGTRYAKFAYIALYKSRKISVTGLSIYLGSFDSLGFDSCHMFVLQLWRRRDPQSSSNMPAELSFMTEKVHQPNFLIPEKIDHYLYKQIDYTLSKNDEIVDRSRTIDESVNIKNVYSRWVHHYEYEFQDMRAAAILLAKGNIPSVQEEKIIDQLLEDVLPHGYA